MATIIRLVLGFIGTALGVILKGLKWILFHPNIVDGFLLSALITIGLYDKYMMTDTGALIFGAVLMISIVWITTSFKILYLLLSIASTLFFGFMAWVFAGATFGWKVIVAILIWLGIRVVFFFVSMDTKEDAPITVGNSELNSGLDVGAGKPKILNVKELEQIINQK